MSAFIQLFSFFIIKINGVAVNSFLFFSIFTQLSKEKYIH